MTGFVKITVSEVNKESLEERREARGVDSAQGAVVSSEVALQHVNIFDKFILLQALMQAIDLDEDELKMYIFMRDCGALKKEQQDLSEEAIE